MNESLEEARARAEASNYIQHVEPNCKGGCGYNDPHKHGIGCHKNCHECKGICHVDCPAYKEDIHGGR